MSNFSGPTKPFWISMHIDSMSSDPSRLKAQSDFKGLGGPGGPPILAPLLQQDASRVRQGQAGPGRVRQGRARAGRGGQWPTGAPTPCPGQADKGAQGMHQLSKRQRGHGGRRIQRLWRANHGLWGCQIELRARRGVYRHLGNQRFCSVLLIC